ncbi:MAG: glyoxalase [Candidatus Marinimicrobia bacterium]|nr:glyoxalase [Candidatus Neomarinimicrobiota bacterium]
MNVLGCSLGRESEDWIDFNLYGNQIVAHLDKNKNEQINKNSVDGDQIPSRHFGVILPRIEWEKLSKKIKKMRIPFLIKPRVRFKDKAGEQATFFINDPSGNALEFKSFEDESFIFKRSIR